MSFLRGTLIGAVSVLVVLSAACAPSKSVGIHELAAAGDLDGVQRLLAEKPELVDARDADGRTPLFAACKSDHAEVVRYLVAHGADVDAKDDYSSTPLHLAAYRDNVASMEILLENGASTDEQNHSQNTPLHLAALADQLAAVELLIESGAALNLEDDYGRTPTVLCARERGGPATMKALIDAGADIDARDRYDDDALELAAWRGKEEVVNLLLDAGAKVPAGGEDAGEMFGYAAENGLTRLFREVVAAGGDPDYELPTGGTLVHSAAAGGSVEILRLLASAGLDIDTPDDYGWTPLHYAARDGRVDCVKWLCEKQVAIDARTLMGQSAYNIAVEREMTAAAEVLTAARADTGPVRFPELEGPYMGQKSPGDEPERFATGIVSSIWNLHCSIVFSPTGDTACWPPMFTYPGEIYSRGNIVMSSKRNGRWTPPTPAPFVGDGRGDAAFFAPDGSRVYFLSRRTLPGEPESQRERIWYADRTEDGWAPARLVDPIVNDYPQHWQFSVDAEHTIYFSSDLPEGQGGGDIYSSTFSGGRWQKPVNLGPQINTREGEGTPFIAPDGSYLIFGRGGDLFISYRKKEGGWTQPQDVGPPINSESRELCPIVSPDGKYLFFLSTRQGSSDVFWVSATFIERLKPADEA